VEDLLPHRDNVGQVPSGFVTAGLAGGRLFEVIGSNNGEGSGHDRVLHFLLRSSFANL
jgi:hypothetical protein